MQNSLHTSPPRTCLPCFQHFNAVFLLSIHTPPLNKGASTKLVFSHFLVSPTLLHQWNVLLLSLSLQCWVHKQHSCVLIRWGCWILGDKSCPCSSVGWLLQPPYSGVSSNLTLGSTSQISVTLGLWFKPTPSQLFITNLSQLSSWLVVIPSIYA